MLLHYKLLQHQRKPKCYLISITDSVKTILQNTYSHLIQRHKRMWIEIGI